MTDQILPVVSVMRISEGAPAGTNQVAIGTGLQSQVVAQREAARADLTRGGRRFAVGFLSTVTGIAPVQTISTIAAQWLLYNPATATKSIFIDELGIVLVSGTAGAGIVLLAVGAALSLRT